MKLKIATAAALLLASTPACAEPPKTEAAAAPVAAAPAATTAAQPFSRETTLENLMANPAAKDATLKVFPDLDKHPAWEMIKGMSPKQIAEATGGIPEDKLAELDTALKDAK